MSYVPKHAPGPWVDWRAVLSDVLALVASLVLLLGVFG